MSTEKKQPGSSFYAQDAQDAVRALQTDAKEGLSAAQAAQRLEQYGPNKLNEARKKTNLQRFLEQFKDVMILILLAAAAVSLR